MKISTIFIGMFIALFGQKITKMKIKYLFTALIMSIMTLHTQAQQHTNILKVKGIAEVKAVPNLMKFTIPLEAKDADYETCTNKLTSVFNDLKGALAKSGVEKESIKSSQLRISEDYKYVDRERVLIGYVGSIQVKIEMENKAENLNKVMKTLNDPRFKFGYNIGFDLSESQRDSLRRSAIETAVADAKEKAKILTQSMNVKLGEVKKINFEYGNGSNSPIVMQKSMLMEEEIVGNNEIELNPDEISVSKSVDIIWQIEQ